MLAYSTGRELSVLSDDVAETTAVGWEAYRESAFAHFEESRRLLDAAEPDYAH